jgi:AcrR family transcriptional regulator
MSTIACETSHIRGGVIDETGHEAVGTPRERIIDAAYDLFSHHGIRAVGVDRVIAQAGVAKMTLYRQFQSKDELVLEFMRTRERRWTREWLQAGAEGRASDPGARLLAIFDVFDGWFREDEFEGCSFINVMLETTEAESRVRSASVAHLATIRAYVEQLATEAGVPEAAAFARRWDIIMKGSIVAAGEGDTDAALHAREIGRLVLADALV